jgi:3-phenylpropionate/cinnamic acid dioxygenase small subunit
MTDGLAQIADEMAIRNLVARLAHLADGGSTLEEYLTHFTEDAIWEYSEETRALAGPDAPNMRLVGVTAIEADRRRLRGAAFQGPRSKTYHLNTTLEVRLLGDGAAEAQSYWLFVAAEGAPQIRRVGHYQDRFRRTEAGWKLAHRIVTPADYTPA